MATFFSIMFFVGLAAGILLLFAGAKHIDKRGNLLPRGKSLIKLGVAIMILSALIGVPFLVGKFSNPESPKAFGGQWIAMVDTIVDNLLAA